MNARVHYPKFENELLENSTSHQVACYNENNFTKKYFELYYKIKIFLSRKQNVIAYYYIA